VVESEEALARVLDRALAAGLGEQIEALVAEGARRG
jgi:hypothetical protein